MTKTFWLWAFFSLMTVAALVADLSLRSHRHRTGPISLRESLSWMAVWVSLAAVFAGCIAWFLGSARALEFGAAYLVEESLSMDNMFVFVLIFNYFHIPRRNQPTVLKWGILGAVILRLVLIVAGVALVNRFRWVFYLFGALVIYTAVHMLSQGDSEGVDPSTNPLLHLAKKLVPMTDELHDQLFLIRKAGRWVATPLFATLLVIEASDLLFAMDSIPAVLAISDSPLIVFTSNVFAILGLRSLYFMVSRFIGLFRFLRYGLAIVLIFIGAKMLLQHFITIPVIWSLVVVAACTSISVLASVLIPQSDQRAL